MTHDYQLFLTIRNIPCIDLHPSLMSLVSYCREVPRALPDPAGPLSSELSPSAIAEANAAVNGMQQAIKTKKRGPYVKYVGVVCSFDDSTHYFLVSILLYGRKYSIARNF